MNENSAQPAERRGFWWFAWILATVIIPGGLFVILLAMTTEPNLVVLFLAGALAFILHIVSSIELGRTGSGWVTVLLIFGGWLLMALSLFVGCVVLVSQSQ